MADVNNDSAEVQVSAPQIAGAVIPFPVQPGQFALKGSDASFTVTRGKPPPSDEEIAATAEGLANLVRQYKAQGAANCRSSRNRLA